MVGLKAFLASLGINESGVIFGLVGALLAAMRHKDCPWWENVITFLTGLALSSIGPAFVVRWLGLDHDPAYYGGIGFVLGYFGMSIMDEVMLVLRSAGRVDWIATLAEKAGLTVKERKEDDK